MILNQVLESQMDDREQEKMLSVNVVMKMRFESVASLLLIQNCMLKLSNTAIAETRYNKQEQYCAAINARNG